MDRTRRQQRIKTSTRSRYTGRRRVRGSGTVDTPKWKTISVGKICPGDHTYVFDGVSYKFQKCSRRRKSCNPEVRRVDRERIGGNENWEY